ncbi:serine/threonine-protein phosphatase with EF-hands 1 [Trichechus manatus latirostris]|uniref:Serine/threonine-protein phosphatase n=1 Tax=Trichechus manatus latirostris TaxID=127582 RepID=A0A2Y9RMA1_TRIMA|nr:serine/threonine-protein phosphatase with EF-hands 1 [Trichechus manatus latirostris]
MGCSDSSFIKDKKSPKVIKAATIIQNWYRGYSARLKARQRHALTVFQSIEYADEQSQMQLSNFFSFMLENYTDEREEDPELIARLFGCNLPDTREDYVKMIDVPDSYDGPRLQFPLTFTDIESLIEGFKQQKILHPHYVLAVLFEAKKVLMQMPNISHISTLLSKEITVCGDLHGKLDDLFLIFYKNGVPSNENPYVFNGDFVDRGKNSIEVLMILLASLLVYPNDLHLNRGNHEDFLMNLRYGFTKEIMQKYRVYGNEILKILEDVYTWLPIATIVDNDILIIHGGLSESTDLNLLHRIERNKMKSVLMPPIPSDGDSAIDLKITKVGSEKIKTSVSLSDQLLQHEWEQVITIFSASNYYEDGSNRGAYLRLSFNTLPKIFQYQVTKATHIRPLYQRVNTVEGSAIRMLKERIIARKTDLVHAFELYDRNKSGKLSLSQWAFSMESVLELNLPWRSLSTRLVLTDRDGNVDYMSSFQNIRIQKPVKEVHSTLIETLYRYRSDLHIIFNIIDTDHSGMISMEEFRTMWKLFKMHYGVPVDDSEVDELANKMDLNKDGSIDFNEFLKAFHVVHRFDPSRKSNKPVVQE